MKVEVQSPSPVERRVTVEVSQDQVKERLSTAFREVAKQARIKGFRPGKAPISLLKRYYGKSVKEDVGDRLVRETMSEALESASLKPATRVSVDKGRVDEKDGFSYELSFEVFETPEALSLEEIEVELAPPAVDPEGVQARLDELQEKNSEMVPVEDRGADEGDTVDFDGQATVEGNALDALSGDGLSVELGREELLPGITDGLKGAKAGDEVEVSVELPEDFSDEAVAGKTATIAVTVNAVRKKESPAVDDEFAKDLGHESLDELKTKIHEELEVDAERKHDEEIAKLVWDKIIDRHELAVPIDAARELAGQMLQGMMGGAPGQPAPQDPKLLDLFLPHAERKLRQDTLVDAIATEWELEASEEEMRATLAKSYGVSEDDEEYMQKLLGIESIQDRVRIQTLTTLVTEKLVERATVVEPDPTAEASAADDEDAGETTESETEAADVAASDESATGSTEEAGS